MYLIQQFIDDQSIEGWKVLTQIPKEHEPMILSMLKYLSGENEGIVKLRLVKRIKGGKGKEARETVFATVELKSHVAL